MTSLSAAAAQYTELGKDVSATWASDLTATFREVTVLGQVSPGRGTEGQVTQQARGWELGRLNRYLAKPQAYISVV